MDSDIFPMVWYQYGIIIERVQNFNFLGLLFNEHMFWKPHIDIIANKLMKFSGILSKLKKILT